MEAQNPRGGPFLCEICGKGLVSRQYLVYHMNTHTGNKPYACDICPKKFAKPSNLNDHHKIHFEAAYECEDCKKKI